MTNQPITHDGLIKLTDGLDIPVMMCNLGVIYRPVDNKDKPMKFEYEEDRECVAVIREFDDGNSSITIKTDEGCTIIYEGDCLTPNHGSHKDFDYDLSKAIRKFYPGDKITITF